MNQKTKTKKVLVNLCNGRSKALLIFRGGHQKAVIAYYEPSKQYLEFMKQHSVRIEQLRERKLPPEDMYLEKMQMSRNTYNFHYRQANKLFDDIAAAGFLNASLDDVWMDIDYDTPVVLPETDKQIELSKIKANWNDIKLG